MSRVEYSYSPVNASASSLQKTQERHWDSIKAAAPPAPLTLSSATVTDYQYDSYGNLTQVTEPGRSDTDRTVNTFTYDPNATVVDPNATLVDPTNTNPPAVPAPGTFLIGSTRAAGKPEAISSTFVQDSWTGLTTGTVADTVNGVGTQLAYDVLGRPTLVKEAAGTGNERRTATTYSVQQRRIITQRSKNAGQADVSQYPSLVTARHFDSRGRLWRSRTLEDGQLSSATSVNDSGVLVDTQYYNSSSGRCTIVSNPYRASATTDATVGWTLTNQDTMGRPTTVWHFAGATAPGCGEGNTLATTGHSITRYSQAATVGGKTGVMTEFTDEQAKVRRTVADGMGRMIGVIEDPLANNYQTQYSYDVLDDLTQVTQGAQQRSFNYDSLKRLTSSSHPEINRPGRARRWRPPTPTPTTGW